ncbi:BON domain-containing protein [Hoeflea prorocentri]|uniref:BON domain-containing protein n=1 Tax=Hoeflea prorocentri TaxID=1922333 RepID=A0A9X3UI78_9HYPH|nr:BON domain-containing protein [Hoeflea prorocentri]MCY6379669.1 BON domain-containing protein [Hoeflea prorocentri]MDA5397469.1 BON domain-containing protein [Hoeflea prorocentri]
MIDDATLKQNVLDELQWDVKVNHAHIGVVTSDGSVTLSGHVESYPEKTAAVDATKRVRGVKALADEISVHLPSERRIDDSDIAGRLAHVLEWNVSIPDSNVQASVHAGHVTLTGEVEWQRQRRHIEEQVLHVSGITGISNKITIKAGPTRSDVKQEIENALLRSSEKEADQIKVTVSGNTVTLEGYVRDFHQRDLIEDAAWAAPGVLYVVDNIRIE